MKTIVLGAIAIIILFFANLAWGSVNIPWQDVGAIISGSQTDETYRYILLESRLPAAIAALLSGAATPWRVLTYSVSAAEPDWR